MSIFRFSHTVRIALSLGMIGVLTAGGGCGGGADQPPSPDAIADSKARAENEHAARLKNFGEKGLGAPAKGAVKR